MSKGNGVATRAAGAAAITRLARRAPVPPRGRARRLIWNLRRGRMQKTLAITTAASAAPLGFEMYLEHYKGSFGDAWMWAPVFASPAVSAVALAAARSERVARTALPVASLIYAAGGLLGTVLHLRGVQRKPGGFSEPTYNLVMGPPLLAPGSLALVGICGVLAALVEPER